MKIEAWKAVRGPAIFVAVYLVLRILFDHMTEDGGLLTPSGMPRLEVAALGLLVLLLRLLALFVVPPLLVYRGVLLAGRAQERDAP